MRLLLQFFSQRATRSLLICRNITNDSVVILYSDTSLRVLQLYNFSPEDVFGIHTHKQTHKIKLYVSKDTLSSSFPFEFYFYISCLTAPAMASNTLLKESFEN